MGTHPIPVLALSEGALPGKGSLSGYVSYSAPSIPTFLYGSAAVYVRKDIPQCVVDTSSLSSANLEVVAVQVTLFRKVTTVVSLYFKSNGSSGLVSVLSELRKMFPGRLIICGDFNAHHPLWGSGKTTSRGTSLVHDLEATDLCLANDGSPTFFRPPAALSSIDLTFHSPDVSMIWEVSPDTQGSDHFPITIRIKDDCSSADKHEFTVVRWDYFRSLFKHDKRPIAVSLLANLGAATTHIRLPADSPAPDLKYANLFAARRFAQRRYRRSRRREDRALYNRLNAAIRRHANHLRRQRWRNLCDEFCQSTSTVMIWKVVRALSGDRGPSRPFACMALALKKTLEELAEVFAEVYAPALLSTPIPIANATPCILDELFTAAELRAALRRLRRRSASGPDGISGQALLNLPEAALLELLGWFNVIWQTGNVPLEWKEAWVVPIPKPGQPQYSPTSYRPVSLTSCVAKLMERMVHARLSWFLESRRLLPNCMMGFRTKVCALDCVLDLISDTEHHHSLQYNTAAVFLDIKKAYDNVKPSVVIHQLAKMGITGRALAFIQGFLSERCIRVRLGRVLSHKKALTRGLPQGCVLSPLLFNIVVSELVPLPPGPAQDVRLTIFADDICLWSSARFNKNLKVRLQAALEHIRLHLNSTGLELSTGS